MQRRYVNIFADYFLTFERMTNMKSYVKKNCCRSIDKQFGIIICRLWEQ